MQKSFACYVFCSFPTLLLSILVCIPTLRSLASTSMDHHLSYLNVSFDQTSERYDFLKTYPIPTTSDERLDHLTHQTSKIISHHQHTARKLVSYKPGFLTVRHNNLLLSEGLEARVVARSGEFVSYVNGKKSTLKFHFNPDAGATFPDLNPINRGGWIYVSNSEIRENNTAGVGSITFNKNGEVIDYRMVLTSTRANCGGGKTPWGAWISCEEFGRGKIWQVDPTGRRTSKKITMGLQSPGLFESFAYDTRNTKAPRFFATKDDTNGEVRRFTPTNPNWTDPWSILYGQGQLDFLVLKPTSTSGGLFEWVTNIEQGKDSAKKFFPNCEGIDVRGNELFLISKKLKMMFILNLDNNSYIATSTRSGSFNGQPDQVTRILGSDNGILYFTEDGGMPAGIFGRNKAGQYFTILEGPGLTDETTGLAFSPDKKKMYVAYQDNGILFVVKRLDELPFDGQILDIKYHSYA